MRDRERLLPVLLLSAAFAAAGAGAQDKPQAQPEKPQKTEAPNPYQERFQQLDRDQDGFVSPAEWPLERAKFDLVDRNRDGRLSRTELLTPNVLRDDDVQERLRRFDTDGDGRLNAAERQREAADHQARQRQRQNAWNPRASLQDQRRFRDLDRNRDNRLTRTEANGAGARFDRLDRNGDGVLTPNEWPRP
jgi:Ca2+-binding EF-hand superfamily protein